MTAERTSLVTFTLEDIDELARVSLDHNPLHCSEPFARRTVFGERVVHGVLGVLHLLAHGPTRAGGGALASLKVDFPNPMFAGVGYRADIEGSGGDLRGRLADGPRVVLKATATFAPRSATFALAPEALGERDEAPTWTDEELATYPEVEGVYAPHGAELEGLCARLGLAERGVPAAQVAVLLACSYLVGMEVPGRRALFSRLQLKFPELATTPPAGPLVYSCRMDLFDERYAMAELAVSFSVGDQVVARGSLSAFARRPAVADDDPETYLARSTAMSGQVALVTGAARGLGSAIAEALALQGCTVLGTYLGSREEAEELAARLASQGGTFVPIQGDAADAAWAAGIAARIEREHGRLDLLVCNASPPLRPLWVEPGALGRIHDFVTTSLGTVAAPLAHLLAQVEAAAGAVVLVSSTAVTAPPAEWPHYVAAKLASEGLLAAAAEEYPRVRFLVARPPRLVTELTNSPRGFESALSPRRVAAHLVQTLLEPRPEGLRLERLDDF